MKKMATKYYAPQSTPFKMLLMLITHPIHLHISVNPEAISQISDHSIS